MTPTDVTVIVALLPLSACLLIFQTNPYHALVIRGILGAVAALVYAVLGAADVALTEALVGTMLAITLYAVAVRSSLVMRLGVLKEPGMDEPGMDEPGMDKPGMDEPGIDEPGIDNVGLGELAALEAPDRDTPTAEETTPLSRSQTDAPLLDDLRTVLKPYHLRLELVPYATSQALQQGLLNREVHGTWTRSPHPATSTLDLKHTPDGQLAHYLAIRIRRLHEILLAELTTPALHLAFVQSDAATPPNAAQVRTEVQE